MTKWAKLILRIAFPLLLAAAILWWMYRGFQWDEIRTALSGGMSWKWMWLSMPFGITAQIFRALRWKQVLQPLGEKPRTSTCVHAIFLSYASSLAIPRLGEVLRCGVLRRWEGTSLSRGIGTVVTERVVDTTMILLLSAITVLVEIPIFLKFLTRTGVSFHGFLSSFTTAGYLVSIGCFILLCATIAFLLWKLHLYSRTRAILGDLRDGLLSIRKVRSPLLFLLYSLGIWVSYYLHFYLTFYCFSSTAHLGPMAALVAFVVGCFAVLVPTPNGAGPWHFAVKTVLVLYGISDAEGAVFALIVHTLQTLLVVLLGFYAMAALAVTKKRKNTQAPIAQ